MKNVTFDFSKWLKFTVGLCGVLGQIAWLAADEPRVVSSPKSIEIERDIVYAERAELKLLADLYYPVVASRTQGHAEENGETAERSEEKPDAEGSAKLPGVLMVHGGAWASGSKMQVAWHATSLARRGYLVMAINYRLAPQHLFPAQIDDCRAALEWLHEHAHRLGVDPDRVGAYGYSAGGHLVCLLALSGQDSDQGESVGTVDTERTSEQADAQAETQAAGQGDDPAAELAPSLRCVVAGGAPCDFSRIPLDSQQFKFWLGATRRERPDLYRQASPLSYVSAASPPILFFHGASDRIVPGTGAERLHQSLQSQGVDTNWYSVPQAGHLQAYLDRGAWEESVKFFDRWLHPRR